MIKFDECKKFFDTDKIGELNDKTEGLLWLMLKSITRKELLIGFCEFSKINLNSTSINSQSKELYEILLFDVKKSLDLLKNFIKTRASLLLIEDEEMIASELYKIRNFSWGGDYTNALDKFLVDRYIKIYKSYDEISKKLETEIPIAVNGYVMCSWYNHWSTIHN